MSGTWGDSLMALRVAGRPSLNRRILRRQLIKAIRAANEATKPKQLIHNGRKP